ncbi:hypothetical protein VNO77_13304 [Canavalia gladiata]|uniref:MPBQ/MBSQ family SAM-binding methyltransferase profile domain-containing protein n=1 Tax=Canavalia gladiata TaxID=3824 RepID=A0AAN9M2I3_CANGL
MYDHVINPGHWTEDMRDDTLESVDLYDRNMRVVDVGGGTGFTTLGIVKHVDDKNVTILDQFPGQLGPKAEDVKKPVNPLLFLSRFILGPIAAIYYVLVPIYMWIKDQIVPKGMFI